MHTFYTRYFSLFDIIIAKIDQPYYEIALNRSQPKFGIYYDAIVKVAFLSTDFNFAKRRHPIPLFFSS